MTDSSTLSIFLPLRITLVKSAYLTPPISVRETSAVAIIRDIKNDIELLTTTLSDCARWHRGN
ncbi:hypothetical protein BB987_16460 [Photorhabdus temperata]|uniref:Uncharacterized protein n=1 Tax=Photorhabdus stackebrandtii TaxID=1123042 RepID=A0A7X5QLK2_9GAMM|nr:MULTISPECIES: hypothetical protein [Photorhabdus]NHB96501.1 hypothetical protein [Photorhabdus stackebrandtii]OHV51640.1 hypothetical protein BB987_16460 [Photorhabdus temperata]